MKPIQILIIFLLSIDIANSYQLFSNTDNGKGNLIIKKVFPAPNYPLSTDKNDIQQLTDGEMVRFPIWTKKKCVGWHNRTPIMLTAEIQTVNNGKNSIKGTLRIHTAKGLYAGVKVLRRIDVYSKVNSKEYVHAGEYHGLKDKWDDRKNHWINVDVNGIGNELEIVIHADGTNIFIDEIEWVPNNKINNASQTTTVLNAQIIKDSTIRLKKAFIDNTIVNLNQQNNNLSQLIVWQDDPWGELSWQPNLENKLATPEINIIGIRSEKESAVLGVLNTKDDQKYNVTISSDQEINNEAIEIGIVEKILSASGKVVFDPIVPIKQSEPFQLKSNQVSYLWLTVDLSKLTPAHYQAKILISSNDLSFQYLIPLNINVIDKEIIVNKPAAINWSYTSNLPIWNNPKKTMDDLVQHGINVFVVPPKHIPQPNIQGKWDINAAIKLKKDLNLFKGKGQVLLIVGWGPAGGGRPSWMFNQPELNEQDKYEILKAWLIQLNTYMKNQGFNHDEWAIYPIDEAHGEKLQFLIKVAQWIKQANSNIRIYANPTLSRKGYARPGHLRVLERLIDIWQPSLAFAKEKAKSFFSDMPTEWWIYDNPIAPVKQASPFDNYRMLSWKAWAIGSAGIGFWSYSDTQGSSAWDDFDGIRPDWAVVYESGSTPITSRRWEAFREGVEDYKLLITTETMGCFPSYLKESGRESLVTNTQTSQSINFIRQQLLSCLEMH